jgi:hypothetical protein
MCTGCLLLSQEHTNNVAGICVRKSPLYVMRLTLHVCVQVCGCGIHHAVVPQDELVPAAAAAAAAAGVSIGRRLQCMHSQAQNAEQLELCTCTHNYLYVLKSATCKQTHVIKRNRLTQLHPGLADALQPASFTHGTSAGCMGTAGQPHICKTRQNITHMHAPWLGRCAPARLLDSRHITSIRHKCRTVGTAHMCCICSFTHQNPVPVNKRSPFEHTSTDQPVPARR